MTPAQVIAKRRKEHLQLIYTGPARMNLMIWWGWTREELHAHSHVSRAMVCGILTLDHLPTEARLNKLVETMGMELFEFNLLARYEVLAEAST